VPRGPRNPFKRSLDLPADIRARIPLDKGEKVLAGTLARDGTWLCGTRDALLIVDPSGAAPDASRIAWERIETVDWDRETEQLKVIEVGEFGRVRPEYAFAIDEPGLLLELIRERVTASVVLQRRVVVSGKRGLFVVARRAPRGSGEISWAYEFDRGVDPADPAVMEAARIGLESAAEELGL